MVTITSVAWIPTRNVRSKPLNTTDDIAAEMVDDRSTVSGNEVQNDEKTMCIDEKTMCIDEKTMSMIDPVESEFDLANYDNENDESAVFGLSVKDLLSLKAESEELSKKIDPEFLEDDDQSIDLDIRPTEFVFSAACAAEDGEMSYETYVYDHRTGHMYQHHEAVIEWLPLCIEPIPTCGESSGNNFLAVGGFAPWIEIWDNDYIDAMEPVAILGKTRKKTESVVESSFAIRSLHYNIIDRTSLAAGNTNGVVEIWNIESKKKFVKIGKKNGSPVASIKWHTHESSLIAIGGDNQLVSLADIRCPDTLKILEPASLTGNVESVCWDRHRPYSLMTAGDRFTGIDIRNFGIMWSIEYDSRFLALTDTLVNGLVAATTEEGVCSIWNTNSQPPYEVTGKHFHNGPLHHITASPDLTVPTILIMGGKDMIVWDVTENDTVNRTFTKNQTNEEEFGSVKTV